MPGVARKLEIFGFGNYLSLRHVVPLRQFSPHRVEAVFDQTPLCIVRLDGLPI